MPRKRQRLGAVYLPPPPPPPLPSSMDLVLGHGDLLTEILLRLPAKTLISLTSVSEKWRSLISSDYFRHRHTLRRPNLQPSLLLQTCKTPRRFFYFNGGKVVTPYANPNMRVLQGCNGLLLQQYSPPGKKGLEKHDPSNSYVVYNPTTKQSRTIPLAHSHSHPDVAAVALAFDPRKSPYYKIVCVRSNSDDYEIEVYESESGAWEVKMEAFSCPDKLSSYGGVAYWNNVVYWSYCISFHEARFHGCYYCFDVEKGVFGEVVLPFPDSEQLGYSRIKSWLQEFDGRMYHVEVRTRSFYTEELRVGVWELNDDDFNKNKWVLKGYHLIHPHPQHPRSRIVRFLRRGGGGGGGGEGPTYYCLMTHQDGKMRAYNLVVHEYEDVDDFPDYAFDVKAFQFGETLALV